jgi:signal transduction histidine kinase
MNIAYSQPNRLKRLIAAGRIVLIAFAVLAVWLRPVVPAAQITPVLLLFVSLLCYSSVLFLFASRKGVGRNGSSLLIHAFDLLIFAVCLLLIFGYDSPFFAFFVLFLVASGALKWGWRGSVCTSAVILGIVTAVAVSSANQPGSGKHTADELICGIIYLVVVAAFMGYLSYRGERHRYRISGLASWPVVIPEEIYPMVSEILSRSALVLAAPRTLLLWNEPQEPGLHAALWSDGQFHHSIWQGDAFGSMVAEAMEGRNFFCINLLEKTPLVLHESPAGYDQWKGMPLDPELMSRYSINSVISVVIKGGGVSGRLFALDRKHMTSDDLELGRVVAHMASLSLDQFYNQEQLRKTAAMEERIRLARDLHDGVLQSMTGTVMQLDAACRLIENNPQTARECLLEIEKQISSDQQNIRSHIQELKTPCLNLPEWDGKLKQRLEELPEKIKRKWNLNVDIDVMLNQTWLPWIIAQGVYFITREAIINGARHAGASSIKAEITSTDHQMKIVVADNGRGFPFTGRYSHDELAAKKMGPAILMERVASLGGRLNIESGAGGASLEITLTIPEIIC